MKRATVRILILLACLGALAWTVAWLGPRKVAAAARDADPLWLTLAVVAVGVRYLVWGLKWRQMLNRRGPVGYVTTLRLVLAGVFVNLTTPTAKLAGGFVRAAFLNRRTGWGYAASYGWSLADQFTNSLGNVVLGGVLMLAATASLPPGSTRSGLFVLGSLALLGPAVLVSLRGWAWRRVDAPGTARWLARLTRNRWRARDGAGNETDWIRPVLEPLLRTGATARVVPLDLGLAALSCSFLCISNACALRAVGAEVPFVHSAAAIVLAGVAGTLAGTLGGIGATELALIGLMGRFDVPADAAAAAALLHRSAYYAVSLGFGAAALLLEGRPERQSRA